MSKALVLLSGGIDSCVVLDYLVREHGDVSTVTFDYGSIHAGREIASAQKIAAHYNVFNSVVNLRPAFQMIQSASSLTGGGGSPVVPGRNAIMLSVAAGIAETFGIPIVAYGATLSDAEDFPDCTAQFVSLIRDTIAISSLDSVLIRAPFVGWKKFEVINEGLKYGAPLELTYTCYRGRETHCGECLACKTRRLAFARAGVDDPVEYDA